VDVLTLVVVEEVAEGMEADVDVMTRVTEVDVEEKKVEEGRIPELLQPGVVLTPGEDKLCEEAVSHLEKGDR